LAGERSPALRAASAWAAARMAPWSALAAPSRASCSSLPTCLGAQAVSAGVAVADQPQPAVGHCPYVGSPGRAEDEKRLVPGGPLLRRLADWLRADRVIGVVVAVHLPIGDRGGAARAAPVVRLDPQRQRRPHRGDSGPGRPQVHGRHGEGLPASAQAGDLDRRRRHEHHLYDNKASQASLTRWPPFRLPRLDRLSKNRGPYWI
jgi:hypothetical protein